MLVRSCIPVLLSGIYVLSPMVASASQSQRAVSAAPFKIKAFHLMVAPHYEGVSYYRDRISSIANHGYNTIVLALGSSVHTSYGLLEMGAGNQYKDKSFNKKELAELVSHARSVGLEPVIELKIIGKMNSTLTGLPVRKNVSEPVGLLKKYPELLLKKTDGRYGTVINLAFEADGKDVFDLVLFPLIDELLTVFGDKPPKYFFLGIDEIRIDELSVFAQQKKETPAKMFGVAVGRLANHLAEKDITPVMWGDMFLSTRLAWPGHGVSGFIFDTRFANANNYHATNRSNNGESVLVAINHIKPSLRKKIIVADWHYSDVANGEYPSVDYFQAMGFKDVWGTPWFDPANLSTFTKYCAIRQCGGMMVTTWGSDATANESKHVFKGILGNSILFFENPATAVPDTHYFQVEYAVDRANTGTVANKDFVKSYPLYLTTKQKIMDVRIALPADFIPASADMIMQHGGKTAVKKHRNPMTTTRLVYDAHNHVLQGQTQLPKVVLGELTYVDVRLDIVDKATGYLIQDYQPNAILIGDEPVLVVGRGKANDTLLGLDFTSVSSLAGTEGVQGYGEFGPYLMWGGNSSKKNVARLTEGGLDCRKVDASARVAHQFWEEIKQNGMVLDISVKLIEVPTDTYVPVVTWGNFSSGWRLLLKRNRQLVLQFARTADGYGPIWLQPKKVLNLGQWSDIRIVLSPPNNQGHRQVSIHVNGSELATTRITRPLTETYVPFGLCVQYIDRSNPRKQWDNFPGLIGKMTVKRFSAADK